MKNEELGPISTWALGLLLLIATMIIIRWIVGFVSWSALDSGWAQAIGSVAAIMASFFLFKRQRDHELQEAKDEALRRRFLAVQTVAVSHTAPWTR